MLLHLPFILNITQKESLRLRPTARPREVARIDYFAKLLHRVAPTPNIDKRSYYRPHHIAQEAVGTNRKAQSTITFHHPFSMCNMAYIRLVVGV